LQKLVAEIMAAWRRAERLTQTLPEASPEREAVERTCERLRDAYQELTHSGVAEALTAAEAKLLLTDAASDLDPNRRCLLEVAREAPRPLIPCRKEDASDPLRRLLLRASLLRLRSQVTTKTRPDPAGLHSIQTDALPRSASLRDPTVRGGTWYFRGPPSPTAGGDVYHSTGPR